MSSLDWTKIEKIYADPNELHLHMVLREKRIGPWETEYLFHEKIHDMFYTARVSKDALDNKAFPAEDMVREEAYRQFAMMAIRSWLPDGATVGSRLAGGVVDTINYKERTIKVKYNG